MLLIFFWFHFAQKYMCRLCIHSLIKEYSEVKFNYEIENGWKLVMYKVNSCKISNVI